MNLVLLGDGQPQPCVTPEQHDQIKREAICTAESAWFHTTTEPGGETPQFTPPAIVDDPRWRSSTAGYYDHRKRLVKLNQKLLCQPEDYRSTLRHELAHALHMSAIQLWRSQGKLLHHDEASPHGYGWAEIMRRMGERPERCHNLDVAAAFPEKYASHTCACGYKATVGRRKLANVKARGSMFICKCHRRLNPDDFKGAARRCPHGTVVRGGRRVCRRALR